MNKKTTILASLMILTSFNVVYPALKTAVVVASAAGLRMLFRVSNRQLLIESNDVASEVSNIKNNQEIMTLLKKLSKKDMVGALQVVNNEAQSFKDRIKARCQWSCNYHYVDEFDKTCNSLDDALRTNSRTILNLISECAFDDLKTIFTNYPENQSMGDKQYSDDSMDNAYLEKVSRSLAGGNSSYPVRYSLEKAKGAMNQWIENPAHVEKVYKKNFIEWVLKLHRKLKESQLLINENRLFEKNEMLRHELEIKSRRMRAAESQAASQRAMAVSAAFAARNSFPPRN